MKKFKNNLDLARNFIINLFTELPALMLSVGFALVILSLFLVDYAMARTIILLAGSVIMFPSLVFSIKKGGEARWALVIVSSFVSIVFTWITSMPGTYLLSDSEGGDFYEVREEYPFFENTYVTRFNDDNVSFYYGSAARDEVDGYVYVFRYTISAKVALSEENLDVINEYDRDFESLMRSKTRPIVERKLQSYIPKIDECSSPHFDITPFFLELSDVVLKGNGNTVSGSLEKKIKG